MAQTQCIGDETLGTACPGGTVTDTSTELPLSGLIDTPQVHHARIVATSATLVPGADLYIDPTSNGSGSQELIVYNTYDNLGQLVNKKVGGAASVTNGNVGAVGLQTVSYDYNVRGWLTDINDVNGTDKLFNFSIRYNDPANGAAPLYNGNISETQWRTANTDSSLKSYSYAYDGLNRITGAAGLGAMSKYDLSGITYDKNGNLLSLTRVGPKSATTVLNDGDDTDYGMMDVLDYAYHDSEMSNRLYKVRDDGEDAFGFKDSSVDTQDYWYDENGNMTIDLNKGITGIDYNYLSLPDKITFNGVNNGNIQYIYDADGNRLRKITSNGTITDYADGGYIYENGELQFFPHPEGYVTPNTSGGFDYVYNYVDHLGSVRLSYTDADGNGSIDPSNEIIEENNYYPFGLTHKGYNNNISPLGNSVAKRFKFGGKELEESFDLNTYDFGARNYMPDIGRWGVIDALADQPEQIDKSPYAYAWNNPAYYTDPDGNCPICVVVLLLLAAEPVMAPTGNPSDGKAFGSAKDMQANIIFAAAGGAGTNSARGFVKEVVKDGIAESAGVPLINPKIAKDLKNLNISQKAKQLETNKKVGKAGEANVKKQLEGELKEGEELLEQATFKTTVDGNTTRSRPDFTVVGKDGNLKKTVDAKTGDATLSKNQKTLKENGGELVGKKFPKHTGKKTKSNTLEERKGDN